MVIPKQMHVFSGLIFSCIEIPRCYPPDITVSRVTSTSARIDWNRLFVPKTGTYHYKYSVSLSRVQDNYQYLRTTEQTSQSINNLRPYRQYNFTVTAVDLGECFGDGYSSNLTIKEDGKSLSLFCLFVRACDCVVVLVFNKKIK